MSYNSSTQKITAPVSIYDVRQCFGLASGDLGTLISTAAINMWSKYKPVRLALRDTYTQWDGTNQRWLDSATWWRGADGLCGLSPYSSSDIQDVMGETAGDMNGWQYMRPGGTANQPYRLTDFAGYNHAATPMLINFLCNENVKRGATFYANCISPPYDSDDNLTINDLMVGGNELYFGVVLTNSSGTTVMIGTNDTPGTPGLSFTFPQNVSLGTYYCYPFLARNRIEPGTVPGENTYYTCPLLDRRTVSVVSTYISMNIVATWTSNGQVRVTLTNNDSISHTVVVSLRFLSSNYSDPLQHGEEQKSQRTILASGVAVETFTNPLQNTSYVVYVLIDGSELRRVNIMQPEPTPV